jgi:hypothetical protein
VLTFVDERRHSLADRVAEIGDAGQVQGGHAGFEEVRVSDQNVRTRVVALSGWSRPNAGGSDRSRAFRARGRVLGHEAGDRAGLDPA